MSLFTIIITIVTPQNSIGWKILREGKIPVNQYENNRPPRRGRNELLMPKEVREQKLLEIWHFSYSSLRNAARSISKERQIRQKSLALSKKLRWHPLQEVNRLIASFRYSLSSCRSCSSTSSAVNTTSITSLIDKTNTDKRLRCSSNTEQSFSSLLTAKEGTTNAIKI